MALDTPIDLLCRLAGMVDAASLIDRLRHLAPDELRERIAQREDEIKALRILLRAARAATGEGQRTRKAPG